MATIKTTIKVQKTVRTIVRGVGRPGSGGGSLPIPASTMLGNFGTETAQATPQDKNSVLSWLDAATNTSLTSLGGTVASIGSDLLTLAEIVDTKVANDDSRLTNAREWIAATVEQAEAELGIGTDRRAWTALRVRQSTRVNPDFDPTGNIFTIGTTAASQRIRLRRRFASAGDFSQLSIDFSGDNCRIQTQQAGNTPNPLVLGTAGVDRVFLSATSTQLGIGGSPTTRPLEIFAGTAGFRLQSSSAVSPPVYTEIARTFDFLTWQDSTSPFNTCTDLVANSNQFNNHSLRVFVHTSGVSDPVLHSVFHSSGRLLVGTEVDNGTDRVQINGNVAITGNTSTLTVGAMNVFPAGLHRIGNLFVSSNNSNGVALGSPGFNDTLRLGNNVAYAPTLGLGGSLFTLPDVLFNRDAANISHQRNGTAGQIARWAKTWTSDTNNTRFEIDCAGNPTTFDLAVCSGSLGGANHGLRIGSKYAGGAFSPFLSFDTSGFASFSQRITVNEPNGGITVLGGCSISSGVDGGTPLVHVRNDGGFSFSAGFNLGATRAGEIRCNSTTNIIRTQSNGGLEVRNLANNAFAPLSCGNVTSNGVFISNDPTTSASALNGFRLSSGLFTGKHGLFSRYGSASQGWVLMTNDVGQIAGVINSAGTWVNQLIGFAGGNVASTNPDVYISRVNSTTLRVGSGPSNSFSITADASLNLANLTASGIVGIGQNPDSTYRLAVSANDSGLAQFTNTSLSSSTGGAGMIGVHNDGAGLANGDRLGFFLLGGSSSSSTVNNSCGLAGFATENWTSTACGARLELLVQPNGTSGTASRIAALTLNHNGQATFTSHVTSAFQALSTDPSTIDIGTGLHRVVKNTTSGEVRDWVNDGGVMKKSPAYT